MNKIYRTVWNDTLRTWVAVPETAKAKGKTRSARVTAGAAVLLGASLGAPAMAADLNLVSSRLTEVPLVGSLTAALSQVATPVSSGASPIASVQVVLQSATAAAMSGITQVVSAVPTSTPVSSAPVMAFGAVEAVTAPVVAALAPVTTAAPIAAITAPIAAITAPLTGGSKSNPLGGLLGDGSTNLVAETVAKVVAPVTNLVPSLTTATSPLSTLTAPLAKVTEPLTAVTEPVAAATKDVLTAVAAPLTAVTTPLAQVTAPLSAVTTPVAAIAQPVTSVVSNITSPLSGVPVLGSLLSPTSSNNTLAASAMAAATPPSGSVAPTLNPAPPSGLVIGTAGLLGGVGQGLAPLTLSVFGQQEAYLRSGALAVNRENINASFRVVNVLGIPILDLAPVTGTLGSTLGGSLPQQNLTLLGGVTSGNYITNINSGLTYNNGLLLPGTTPPSYVQQNNCLNVLGLAGATCWDVPAAQNNQVLIGDGASANGSGEVVIGTNAKHLLPNENANDIFTDPTKLGVPDTNYAARKGHSVVIGDSASGTANGQTIIGAEATSSVAGGVALGFQSVADRVGSGVEAYSGVAVPVAGAVSVGSVGRERQITNVAGGTADTDAVNLRQLKALETQIGAGDANAVKYDDATKSIVTLAGVATQSVQSNARVFAAAAAPTIASGGTKITNLKAGDVSETSTDAINGSQLNATNYVVNNLDTTVTNLDTTVTNINNTGTKYFQANSVLAGASATGTESIAGGGGATATAANTVALGTGAAATQANSVALGAGSTTTVGAQTSYTAFALTPLQNSAGEVSVGAAGAERKITNVAAGSSDTDAANIAQLKAVNSQVSDLDKLAVKYDDATKTQITLNSTGAATRISNVANGLVDSDAVNLAQLKAVNTQVDDLDKLAVKYDDNTKTLVTMNKGGVATRITNVAAGAVTATSSDAINGSQLWGWTQDTTNVYSNTSLYNSIQTINNGGGVKYFRANSTLADAQATGTNSVAVGPAAVASGASSIATGNGATASGAGAVATGAGAVAATDNSVAVGANAKATAANATAVGANTTVTGANAVALGNGSVADRANSVSVGAVGAERQITNVADGTADTDAANMRQVRAITGDVDDVIKGKAGMFQVENSLDRPAPKPTGVDSVAGGAGAVAVGDKATALGNASSAGGENSVAVGNASNSSGANATALGQSSVASGASSTALGQSSIASGASSTAIGQASTASGANSIAVGNTSQALSSGGMAIGNGTVVASAALNSAAIGNGAQATAAATNSVALGNNSVADRANTVSVGAVNNERTISNVAAGSQGTDAVNLQQLRDATSGYTNDISNLRGDLKKYERNSYAGAASAMAVAGLPQAYTPGKSMASAAVSNYLGQSAIAIGVSTITDNGRWVYKLAGNVNSQGKLGAVLGAGYQW